MTLRAPGVALGLACVLAVAFSVPAVAAWNQPVGGASPINHADDASTMRPSLASVGGVPHIAWSESDGPNYEVRVSRLNPAGTAWEEVVGGPSPINHTDDGDAAAPSLAAIGGVPYVAWSEFDGSKYEIRVSRLNAPGTAWEEVVGGPSPINNAGQSAVQPSLASIGGVPGVAWTEDDGSGVYQLRVSRLNAAGTVWEQVVGGASPINHANNMSALRPSLASIDGVPHVAWHESDGTNTEIRVSRLDADGTAWEPVVGGPSPINEADDAFASDPSLIAVGEIPHVAWAETDGTNAEIRVSRLNATGKAWEQVVGGVSPINDADDRFAALPSLTAIGGVPYVAWSEDDGTFTYQVRVSRLNATGTAWEQVVGGASPVNDAADQSADPPSLASVGGVPYVAWTEQDGTNSELRASRLEPEFLSQSASPSVTGASLTSEWRTYGVEFGLGFQYGESLQHSTIATTTPAGADMATINQQIAGLAPSTGYAFRAYATAGVPAPQLFGPTQNFTTLAGPGPEPVPAPAADPVPPATDSTPPETKFDKRPRNKLEGSKATYEFGSSEPGSRFECRLDRKRYRSCASPRRLKRLKPGKHRFSVRAIDAGGNADPTPARDRFRIVRGA